MLCYVNAKSYSESDSLALVALYNSTKGENWVKSDNWLTGNINTWYGVHIKNGVIDAINLSANNLDGQLPEELYQLSSLKYMYISYNQITGELGNGIGNLKQLEVIWASNNNLSGELPAALGGCDSLKTIYLNNNNLSGAIPDTLGSLKNLENVNLSFNNLIGFLPGALGNLNKLKYLKVSNNKLSGDIPQSFTNLNCLRSLRIDNNRFSGIPDLTSLMELYNSGMEREFKVFGNYLDFTDLVKNKSKYSKQSDFFPQNDFVLNDIINLHPGDMVHLNLPASSFVDTSDSRNSYRYLRDNSPLADWTAASDLEISTATYIDNGTYKCDVKHDSFPDLSITVSNVRLLPPSGKSWISLGTKMDGPIVDTIDYNLIALKKVGDDYQKIDVEDTLLNLRREFLIGTGTYLLRLEPTGNDTVLMPKYHRNSARWVNNQLSTFSNRKDYAYNVTFVEKLTSEGIASISGVVNASDVMPGEEKAAGLETALDSVWVMLYSVNEANWVELQLTKNGGKYSFENLAFGEYKVYLEKPGITQGDPAVITLSEELAVADSINFTIYTQENIAVKLDQAERNVLTNDAFKVVNSIGQIKVLINVENSRSMELSVYDLTGKQIVNEPIKSSVYQLPEKLNKGIYIFSLKADSERISKKVLIQ